jgi:rubredoxin/SAM-dependent methyltransferase
VLTESIVCPLCQSKDHSLFHKDQHREYFQCSVCSFVFVPSQYHLSESEEKLRYDTHNNDPQDSRYRQFLSQLTLPLEGLVPGQSVGLDFGSGPGPTLSLMLEEKGYQVALYDKYYAKDESVFDKEFDFITLTEVIEHLSDPIFELKRLTSMLKPGGCIAIMTQTMTKEIDFSKWYYKNDPSHIGFYNQESLIFLANYLGLGVNFHSDRVIFFINN